MRLISGGMLYGALSTAASTTQSMLLQRAGERALSQEVSRAFNVGSPEELQVRPASLRSTSVTGGPIWGGPPPPQRHALL